MHPLIPVGPSHEAGAVYSVMVSARPPEAESSNTVVRLARVRLLRLSTTSLAIWSLPVQIAAETTTEPELMVSTMSSAVTPSITEASFILKKVW